MNDYEQSLFQSEETRPLPSKAEYTASDIEVLEGLEPVRRRPGMYIGGTDTRALHHLFSEVLDNAMDEAVAGHATCIDIHLIRENLLLVSDNGRGIPIDPHPKFPDKSALEVIMTTLHAGGKFTGGAYKTSGGLHGVGISVVNALSEYLSVEVVRNRKKYRQDFVRGIPKAPLSCLGATSHRQGTTLSFMPDPEIFNQNFAFDPAVLLSMVRSKAYLFAGVTLRWQCCSALVPKKTKTPVPEKAVFHFPGGLKDYLLEEVDPHAFIIDGAFAGSTKTNAQGERLEWALVWLSSKNGFVRSYCNTIPTAEGGTHEIGFRSALLRSLKAYAELSGKKKAATITSEDLQGSCAALLSVFITEAEFSGQTKGKLISARALRFVEAALRDAFDHWLAASPTDADRLLDFLIEVAQERLRKRREKEVDRKTALTRLRLPGKMADCASTTAKGAELFIVEGDSAGGSAKQARNRYNQAIFPLRGKILNVESAAKGKFLDNQQLKDLIQALGCGTRESYTEADLRYERVIIMTDADVDGAHIASLLMTFFYREYYTLIKEGHLYLAVPPLYRLSQGGRVLYARDDTHKEHLLKQVFSKRGPIEISRFKGLGEMMPRQLKETTMDPQSRTLLRVCLPEARSRETDARVVQLMGTKPESRFAFICEKANFVLPLDVG